MTERENYEAPKRDAGDIAHAIVRAGVSSVPLVGAAATELLQLLITPPLEKRRDEWMNKIGLALLELEMDRGIHIEDLQMNEAFITVMMQASQVAIRNHQQEKIQALRNVVFNTALSTNISEDLQSQFIRYIDELTPSHFALLKVFVDKEQQLSSVTSYEQLYQACVSQSSLHIDREQFRLLCIDLTARFLLRISPTVSDFGGVYQPDFIETGQPLADGPMVSVTYASKTFLQFISGSS
jgi:hypothetical protein